ncbi:hypothetical protein CS8_092380 [Cupriavidus sp. 8B]
MAIRWILDQGPTIALWGPRRPDQLRGINDAFGWMLSTQDKADIDTLLAQHVTDPVGSDFMAPSRRWHERGETTIQAAAVQARARRAALAASNAVNPAANSGPAA